MTKIELLSFLNNPHIPDETELRVLAGGSSNYYADIKIGLINQDTIPSILISAA